MEIKYIVKNSTQQPVITMEYSILNMAAGNGIVMAPEQKNSPAITEGPKVIHVGQYNRNKKRASTAQSDFYMDSDDTFMSLGLRMQILAAASQKTATSKEIPITQSAH